MQLNIDALEGAWVCLASLDVKKLLVLTTARSAVDEAIRLAAADLIGV